MSSPLLSVSNLSFSYGNGPLILKNISFSLNEGSSLGIIGPNGGGKTTLLKIIVGILKHGTGQILYEGKTSDPKKTTISYLPQAEKLNDLLPLRVKDVVCLGALREETHPHNLHETLKLVGMEDKGNMLMSNLSGGQRQRALLAKALLSRPKLLVLDEPTKGLDSSGQDQLLDLLSEIKENTRAGIIIVDHNITQVIKHCDQILCLNRTYHWHDQKELLDRKVLESVYHCEFEHLLIHETPVAGEIPHHHHQDENKDKDNDA